jgi:hypothetical protein
MFQAKRKLELEPLLPMNEGFKTPKAKKRRTSSISSTGLSPKVKSPLEKTRYDTSLGLLTKKFVGLLRAAPDGVSVEGDSSDNSWFLKLN